jgi:hypothetical protein
MNSVRNTLGMAVVSLAFSLLAPRNTSACTCVVSAESNEPAWPTFEQAVPRSEVAFIGRVVAQSVLSSRKGPNVPFLDVRVIHAIKGVREGATVRVWDGAFGSSCELDLRPLKRDRIVAFSVERNKPEYREYQELLHLSVEPDAYLIGSCGEYYRPLASEDRARQLAQKLKGRDHGK